MESTVLDGRQVHPTKLEELPVMAKAAWLTRFGQDGQGVNRTCPRDRCQPLIVRKVLDKRRGAIFDLIALCDETATLRPNDCDLARGPSGPY